MPWGEKGIKQANMHVPGAAIHLYQFKRSTTRFAGDTISVLLSPLRPQSRERGHGVHPTPTVPKTEPGNHSE